MVGTPRTLLRFHMFRVNEEHGGRYACTPCRRLDAVGAARKRNRRDPTAVILERHVCSDFSCSLR